ncbi:hypothetical protein [Helicobacter macacae]|uniref:hypothetical protein n=1 Tax=Helicobacter macacae TaxID=398626 RepID=UPI000407E434|nr:hypothetical protein [Helicobacter macacae]
MAISQGRGLNKESILTLREGDSRVANILALRANILVLREGAFKVPNLSATIYYLGEGC